MTFFDIVLRTEASLHPEGEPDDFITEYRGIIRCFGEDNVVRRVGKVRAYRINAAVAADHGEPLFDVCNAHSQEMQHIYSLLYDPDQGHFKESITNRFHAMESDCLVLDYVILHPKWRGLRLGLLPPERWWTCSVAAADWLSLTSLPCDMTPTNDYGCRRLGYLDRRRRRLDRKRS